MVDYGFISIHRSLQSHWLWNEKPFDKRAAWIDLLLLANFQDNKFVLGNELVSVERGSFITSELKLMERWGWSKTKVRSFLKLLENDNMIVKKSDTKKTAITIVNYSVYQDKRTTKEPEKNHGETTEKLQKDTNNKDNKENKEKKEKDIDDLFEELISLYVNRSGKSSIKKSTKEKIYKVGREKMIHAIENYKKELAIENWKKPLNASTFFNTRYDDYLEENYSGVSGSKKLETKIVDTTPKPNDLSIFD